MKLEGPVTARVSAKSAGGPGKIQWRTADQPEFPKEGQMVEFTFPPGDRASETTVALPVKGSLLHLRLYLPVQKSPVELDWVEFKPATGKPQRWDFDKP